MHQLPIEIKKRMNRKSTRDVFGNIVYSLMSNFSMSFEECCKLPFPMAMELMKRLQKERKELERKTKMRGRKA